ncbi:hypothetical protein [Faucicola atlantae]|uniref:hypothetical protein n=1 Tax=Faucicola atlantae TaxID=34059 RepID=UPI0025B07B1A|nr:hypothetical protein [Moraxella atlantae]
MSHRSAPFVVPDFHQLSLEQYNQLELDPSQAGTLDAKTQKKHVKALLSTLQADIAQFRADFFHHPRSRKSKIYRFMQAIWQACKPISTTGSRYLRALSSFTPRQGCRPTIYHCQLALRFRSLFIMLPSCI